MVRKEFIVEEITKLMGNTGTDKEHRHNSARPPRKDNSYRFASRQGRTDLKAVAGDVLYTNYEAIEKDRRMTIKSANISLGFNYKEGTT